MAADPTDEDVVREPEVQADQVHEPEVRTDLVDAVLADFQEQTEARRTKDLPGVALGLRGPADLSARNDDEVGRYALRFRESIAATWWLLGQASPAFRGANRRELLPKGIRMAFTGKPDPVPAEGPCLEIAAALDSQAHPEVAWAMLRGFRSIVETEAPPERRMEALDHAQHPTWFILSRLGQDQCVDREEHEMLRRIRATLGLVPEVPDTPALRSTEAQVRRGAAGVYHLVVGVEGPGRTLPRIAKEGAFFMMFLRQTYSLYTDGPKEEFLTHIRSLGAMEEREAVAEDAITKAVRRAREDLSRDQAEDVAKELVQVAQRTASRSTWLGLALGPRRLRDAVKRVRAAVDAGVA